MMVRSIASKLLLAAACVAALPSSPTLARPAWARLAPAQPNFAAQFPSRVLAAHNAVRGQAGVPALTWDPALGQAAAAYAQEMAFTNRFAHSDRKARRGIGENLWMGTRGAYSVETMVGGWASEKRMFSAGVFPSVSRTGNWVDVGHYTQMIWPGTQRVGCAIGANARTEYLVCRYWPAGNMDGRPVGTAVTRAALAR